jgi:hypothetical protein
MSFGKLGALGRGFGHLGNHLGGASSPPAPGGAPTLQFDETTNSQLLALLEDF